MRRRVQEERGEDCNAKCRSVWRQLASNQPAGKGQLMCETNSEGENAWGWRLENVRTDKNLEKNARLKSKPADKAQAIASERVGGDLSKVQVRAARQRRMQKLRAHRITTGQHDKLIALKLKRRQSSEIVKEKERNRIRERQAKRASTLAIKAEVDIRSEVSTLSSYRFENPTVVAVPVSEANSDRSLKKTPQRLERFEQYIDGCSESAQPVACNERRINSSDSDWQWQNQQWLERLKTTLDDESDKESTVQDKTAMFEKVAASESTKCVKWCRQMQEERGRGSDTEEAMYASVRRSSDKVNIGQKSCQVFNTDPENKNADKGRNAVQHPHSRSDKEEQNKSIKVAPPVALSNVQATAARQRRMRKLHSSRLAIGVHEKLTALKLKRLQLRDEMAKKKSELRARRAKQSSQDSSEPAFMHEDANGTRGSTLLPPNTEGKSDDARSSL